MRLYFLRHAHAIPGLDDGSRPLSDKGEAQCTQIADFCRRAGIVFTAAYASPLVRARVTAEKVVQIVNASSPIDVELVEVLTNESPEESFLGWLAQLPEEGHVLLVGHMPSLAAHARRVLGMASPLHLSLPKAGLLCADMFNDRQGSLKFMVSPKVL